MTNSIDTIGCLGGVTIAVSLIPQVIKTFRTKSATDISYAYQAVYIVGCTLVNTYAILEGLWPVYVPCLIEESLVITLTIMKVVYDRRKRTRLASQMSKMTERTDQSTAEGATDVACDDMEEGVRDRVDQEAE